MAEFWTTSGLDLLVATQRSRRRASLEDGLRQAIESGRLAYGTRLPSSRSLADDLGWSRGTVTAAYDQLISDGYLHARQGSATVVGFRPDRSNTVAEATPSGTPWRYDLRPGTTPIGSFPVEEWLRHQGSALRDAPPTAFGYGDPAGTIELRTALAAYLGRVRGIRASPETIVITAGITQALSLLAAVLRQTHPGRTIATEDPGFWFHRDALARSGLPIVPLPVDQEGADPQGLDVAAVLVTPAHQYPTGVTMSPARRRSLVAWARGNDALIIEDDYDGELRHDRRPVPALQADAPDRVIFAGTASKALSPAVRVGWLVVPEALVDTVGQTQRHLLHNVDITTQLGLAHVISHHAYDQRVRAIRVAYRRRYQQLSALVSTLTESFPGMRLVGVRAGGQAPLLLPPAGPSEQDIVASAASEGLALEELAASSHTPGSHPPGLLLGYAHPADHRYHATLQALGRVLRREFA
ncbi:PLP-dependent aminotransferase family protein [Microbacterium cremeum]|uniref:MocR-like pyridoxine biosynthesis transcription factor PdxR n=1 Tax=Microbacterium cremeum TaxID=2782169 RepID=UPI0018898370|nr:PLP-dependent aminotransferase family protein [Microbacterium cremeum]